MIKLTPPPLKGRSAEDAAQEAARLVTLRDAGEHLLAEIDEVIDGSRQQGEMGEK